MALPDGFLGQLLATVLVSTIFALTLALAVRYQAFDYRSFFRLLLGRAWFLFELLLMVLFVLVLAVMGSAAGGILQDSLGLPERTGAVVMLVLVVLLTFFGRDLITRVLASWSVLLYAVFLSYFVAVITGLTPEDLAGKLDWEVDSSWMVSGLQYALYNVSAVPIILYAARAIETEKQAYTSGVVGGLIAMFPGILFHLSFVGAYPGILEAELPVYSQFDALEMPVLYAFYLVVLFGTFIETGAGNIQGFHRAGRHLVAGAQIGAAPTLAARLHRRGRADHRQPAVRGGDRRSHRRGLWWNRVGIPVRLPDPSIHNRCLSTG